MKIVVGYLRSPQGQAALNVAATAAEDLGAELIVVHTFENEEIGGDRYETDVEEVSDRLEARGIAHSIRALSRGLGPAEDIVKVARDVGAALVVVGLRTRSPVGKALLGSVTQTVLFDSPCPVLTVKADSGGRWTVPMRQVESERRRSSGGSLEVDPRDAPPS